LGWRNQIRRKLAVSSQCNLTVVVLRSGDEEDRTLIWNGKFGSGSTPRPWPNLRYSTVSALFSRRQAVLLTLAAMVEVSISTIQYVERQYK
jgi:hypothetical protein